MKVVKNYDDRPDAKNTIDLKEGLLPILERLDAFLEGIEKKKPEIMEAYQESLTNQLQEKFGNPGLDLKTIRVPYIQEEIVEYDELHLLYLQAILQLLGVPENHAADKLETTWSRALKAMLHPAFYRCRALVEVMGREPAIDFTKDYIDTRAYEVIKPDLEMEDLDPIWESWQDQQDSPPHGAIEFRISKGKIGGRVDRCMWHEVLQPFNDPEISYIVACYGDKAGMEARNPNIVFTRTTTFIKGGPYCDNCIHDKRHVEKIEHPPQEFYKELDNYVKG